MAAPINTGIERWNPSDPAGWPDSPDIHFVFLIETHGPWIACLRFCSRSIFLGVYLADLLFAARRYGDRIASAIEATKLPDSAEVQLLSFDLEGREEIERSKSTRIALGADDLYWRYR